MNSIPLSIHLPQLFSAILAVLLLYFSQVQGTQEQSIVFYKERGCLSINNNSLGTINDSTVGLPSNLGSALSFWVNGIWKLNFCGPTVPGPTRCKASVFRFEGSCNSRSSNSNYNFIDAERFGNAFQNGSEIVFFSETNFRGKSIRSDEYGLNLINEETINSWYFTGNHNWTVFSGANFTGTKDCFQPNNNLTISRGYGFNLSMNDLRTVGSVMFSCDGTGTIPTTEIPTTTISTITISTTTISTTTMTTTRIINTSEKYSSANSISNIEFSLLVLLLSCTVFLGV